MHKDFYTKLDEWLGGFFSADGCLRIEYPTLRRKIYFQKFLIRPKATIIQKISPINLAGFIEGDGCIGVTIMKTKRNYNMRPFVRASQNLYPQYSLIEFIQGYLNIVNINSNITSRKQGLGVAQILHIVGIKNVWSFLRLIYPFMIGTKGLQAKIMLDEILPRLYFNIHSSSIRGFIETVGWIDKMNKLKGGLRGKYNQKYFKIEFDFREEAPLIPFVQQYKKLIKENWYKIRVLKESGIDFPLRYDILQYLIPKAI